MSFHLNKDSARHAAKKIFFKKTDFTWTLLMYLPHQQGQTQGWRDQFQRKTIWVRFNWEDLTELKMPLTLWASSSHLRSPNYYIFTGLLWGPEGAWEVPALVASFQASGNLISLWADFIWEGFILPCHPHPTLDPNSTQKERISQQYNEFKTPMTAQSKSLSRVWLFANLWTVARQAPLSTEFSRQEYWSG